MRARFAAYAVGAVDYIIETTDPSGDAYEADEAAWRESIERFSEQTEFVSVEIVDSHREDSSATVTFRAGLRRDGQDASFTERSRFRRDADRWFYVDGEQLEQEE